MVNPKSLKVAWRKNSMPKKSKRLSSEVSDLDNLSADAKLPGISARGRVLMWGPIPVGYIVSARGTAIKVMYVCPVCGAIYSHARNWRYHVRTKHPDFYQRVSAKMAAMTFDALEAYHNAIKRRIESGVTSTSSVTSMPAMSSVSRLSSVPSRPIEEALRRELETSLRVPLPPNLPVLNPKWPKLPFEGEEPK